MRVRMKREAEQNADIDYETHAFQKSIKMLHHQSSLKEDPERIDSMKHEQS